MQPKKSVRTGRRTGTSSSLTRPRSPFGARFVHDVEAIKPPRKDRDALNLYLRGRRRHAVLLKGELELGRPQHPEAPEVISPVRRRA
jgi:hypothetical protein